MVRIWLPAAIVLVFSIGSSFAQTTALWLFDEQIGISPSAVLNDSSDHDIPMVIGPGGQITPGKFGNALEPLPHPPIPIPAGPVMFGLERVEIPKGRTVEPMTWMNAGFCALMTSGENHLRKEVGFASPTKTRLSLGNFDWTVEFWFQPSSRTDEEGVVFEIGQGPRGENDVVTRLSLDKTLRGFTFFNHPSGTRLKIQSDQAALNPQNSSWHHMAFVYSASQKTLSHFVDGRIQATLENVSLRSLDQGDEDYMSVGRDGLWKKPLQGRIDELRFSEAALYRGPFSPTTTTLRFERHATGCISNDPRRERLTEVSPTSSFRSRWVGLETRSSIPMGPPKCAGSTLPGFTIAAYSCTPPRTGGIGDATRFMPSHSGRGRNLPRSTTTSASSMSDTTAQG